MSGVPVWFYAVQGLGFAAALGQAVYFLAAGLPRALRRRRKRRDR